MSLVTINLSALANVGYILNNLRGDSVYLKCCTK